MKKEDSKPQLLRDSIKALISTLQGLSNLAPGCAIVAMILTSAIIIISLNFAPIMMGITMLIVLVVSIIVYSQTENYGEAALALVAGLLTVYTVEWDSAKFVTFISLWVGLSLFIFLISSVKLAAEQEEILSDAAISVKADNVKKQIEKYKKISNDKFIKMLGPIKRAEIIRLFAFRKVPEESMVFGLRAVEMLSTITRVDYLDTARFVIDVYKMNQSLPGPLYQNLLDDVYETIRGSTVSPDEFISAFRNSRHLVLSGRIEPKRYFHQLSLALDQGVAPNEIYEHLDGELLNRNL